MKALSLLVLASAAFGFAGSAAAQFAKPDDAIKYRKNALFVAKAAADNAAIAESMAKLPWAAFGEGTDLGDTKAKPEIWKEQAKFKQAADKLQVEMGKLAAAAKTGNLDSIKTAFNATSGTCKACHDDFRAK